MTRHVGNLRETDSFVESTIEASSAAPTTGLGVSCPQSSRGNSSIFTTTAIAKVDYFSQTPETMALETEQNEIEGDGTGEATEEELKEKHSLTLVEETSQAKDSISLLIDEIRQSMEKSRQDLDVCNQTPSPLLSD